MNKKNKQVLIAAMIAMIFGIVTFIPSVLTAFPYVQKVIEKAQQPLVANEVFKATTPVKDVNVMALDANVRIEQTDAPEVRVIVEQSATQAAAATVELVEQAMEISTEVKWQFPQISSDANALIEEVAQLALNNQLPTIVVQVPKDQPINLTVNKARDLTIVDSKSIAESLTFKSEGTIEITNVSAPTSKKTFTYEQPQPQYYFYGSGIIEYHLLNAFSDVVIKGENIDLSNRDYYTDKLTTTNVVVEAPYINYEMIPFSGTLTLRNPHQVGGISLQLDSIANHEWNIKARDVYFSGYSEDANIVSEAQWEFNGYFFPEMAKAEGKLVIEAGSLNTNTPYFSQSFRDFVKTQASLKLRTSDDEQNDYESNSIDEDVE